jgi:hypothetical protein
MPIYKRLYYTGFAAYATMLVLSVVFYKERMVLPDTAFFLFNIVKDNWFCIQVYRFGDVFSQLLAVPARRMGLPLDVIMVCYSAGFTLFHFACYAICGSVLKQYRFALVILLANLLFTTGSYYWAISQLPQSISLLMVLMALLADRKWENLRAYEKTIAAFLAITLAFFHPLAIFVLTYAILYFSSTGNILERKAAYFVSAIYVAALAAKAIFFRTPYEQHSLSGLKNFAALFPNYFTTYANASFLVKCTGPYMAIPVLVAIIVALYIREAKWRRLSFFILCFIGYLFLINISYYSSKTPNFYIESLYMPLALILALPFVFEALAPSKNAFFNVFICGLIVIVGCMRLYTTHHTYTARLNWERALMGNYMDKKIILDAKKRNTAILQMLWGTPYEFWLLSTTERGKTASIIIDENPGERGWAWQLNNSFLVNWDVVPYRHLPVKYFRFTDSTFGYNIEK